MTTLEEMADILSQSKEHILITKVCDSKWYMTTVGIDESYAFTIIKIISKSIESNHLDNIIFLSDYNKDEVN